MKLQKICLLALACVWSAGALAQWQWIDKDGRKVFSDRAPPVGIPEKDILRQPHQIVRPAPTRTEGDGADTQAISTPASSSAPAADKPALNAQAKGVDKELEERKAKADAEKAAKKKADEKKIAAARTENCTRAKQAKASLDSGQMMKHTNAKGEQVFMDEATRAAERKRAQSVIDSDCKP